MFEARVASTEAIRHLFDLLEHCFFWLFIVIENKFVRGQFLDLGFAFLVRLDREDIVFDRPRAGFLRDWLAVNHHSQLQLPVCVEFPHHSLGE